MDKQSLAGLPKFFNFSAGKFPSISPLACFASWLLGCWSTPGAPPPPYMYLVMSQISVHAAAFACFAFFAACGRSRFCVNNCRVNTSCTVSNKAVRKQKAFLSKGGEEVDDRKRKYNSMTTSDVRRKKMKYGVYVSLVFVVRRCLMCVYLFVSYIYSSRVIFYLFFFSSISRNRM